MTIAPSLADLAPAYTQDVMCTGCTIEMVAGVGYVHEEGCPGGETVVSNQKFFLDDGEVDQDAWLKATGVTRSRIPVPGETGLKQVGNLVCHYCRTSVPHDFFIPTIHKHGCGNSDGWEHVEIRDVHYFVNGCEVGKAAYEEAERAQLAERRAELTMSGGTTFEIRSNELPYHLDGRERTALTLGLRGLLAAIPASVRDAVKPSYDELLRSPVVAVEWAQIARANALIRGITYVRESAVHDGPERWGGWYNVAACMIELWVEGTPLSERWTPWQEVVLDRWAEVNAGALEADRDQRSTDS